MLLVKRLRSDATLPERKSAMAAGYDLFTPEKVILESHKTSFVKTGIALTVPEGTYGRVAPRSSLSKLSLFVNAGVIDRDYTGEVIVCLYNASDNAITLEAGDRIAQLILEKIDTSPVVEVDDLQNTERGSGGFGSTGK